MSDDTASAAPKSTRSNNRKSRSTRASPSTPMTPASGMSAIRGTRTTSFPSSLSRTSRIAPSDSGTVTTMSSSLVMSAGEAAGRRGRTMTTTTLASTHKMACTESEIYEQACVNGGECFAVKLKTANRQSQRVVGCTCPPDWKGESCETRHYDYSLWSDDDTRTASLAGGVVLAFVVVFVAVVGGATYCWFRKKRLEAQQSTLKRPLKCESSGAASPCAVAGDGYDDDGSPFGTLVAATGSSRAPHDGHYPNNSYTEVTAIRINDVDCHPLTASRAFQTYSAQPTTSTMPPRCLPFQCPTCASVNAGMLGVPDATAAASKTGTGSGLLLVPPGGGEQTARQASSYDNCVGNTPLPVI